MKGIFKKKITIVILLLTVISLVFTGIILMKMVKDASGKEQRAWFFEESIQTGQPVILKNAYILSNTEEKMNFLYDYKTYEVEGSMIQEYTGIADIHIDGDHVAKVFVALSVFTEKNQMVWIVINTIHPVFHSSTGNIHLTADDGLDSGSLGCLVKIDAAVHHAVVRQCNSRLPQLLDPVHQTVNPASTVQEAVFGMDM